MRPVLVIVSVLVGASLLGILGALLAIPAAATIQIVVQEWWRARHPATPYRIRWGERAGRRAARRRAAAGCARSPGAGSGVACPAMFAATLLAIAAAATPHGPAVQAHRGGSFVDGRATYAEATMPAFRAAAKRGDVLEFDIQMSADGVPVVMHDDTLDRTTVCTGPVSARTAADIRAACPTDVLGSPGSALGSSRRPSAPACPTLAEVLALVKKTGARASDRAQAVRPERRRAPTRWPPRSGPPASQSTGSSCSRSSRRTCRRSPRAAGVATATLTLKAGEGTSIAAARSSGSRWVSPQWPVSASPTCARPTPRG